MKKIIAGFVLLGLVQSSTAQWDCKWAPPEKVVLAKMATKPVNNIYYGDFQETCNITTAVKKKLLYCLDWHWTKEEIDTYCERELRESKDFYRIEEKARDIAKGNDTLYKVSYDSIKNNIKKAVMKTIRYGVDGNLILGAAYGNVREAIPLLRKAYGDGHYNIINVELALARFGDKAMEKKALNRIRNPSHLDGREWVDSFYLDASDKLFYILSQESIYKTNEWMDTSKSYRLAYYHGNGFNPPIKSAIHVLLSLKYLINNPDFQELIGRLHYKRSNGFNDTALILACKKWLITHKGKYQINKSYRGLENPWDMEDF
jgi:hypothetical protein